MLPNKRIAWAVMILFPAFAAGIFLCENPDLHKAFGLLAAAGTFIIMHLSKNKVELMVFQWMILLGVVVLLQLLNTWELSSIVLFSSDAEELPKFFIREVLALGLVLQLGRGLGEAPRPHPNGLGVLPPDRLRNPYGDQLTSTLRGWLLCQ